MVLPTPKEKERTVQEMFTSIASRYDLNNTLLSFGLHYRWKRFAVEQVYVHQGDKVLDLCAGTGDLSFLLAEKVGGHGYVAALDLNERMLSLGRQKIRNAHLRQVHHLISNAEHLPFSENRFEAVTVAFGIRNVSNIHNVLNEIYRVLRPGGRMACLEFSVPHNPFLRKLYDFYSFYWLRWVGTMVSGDKAGTYCYLPASIRSFPDQETFRLILTDTGFTNVTYQNLTGGIVAVHTGIKPA